MEKALIPVLGLVSVILAGSPLIYTSGTTGVIAGAGIVLSYLSLRLMKKKVLEEGRTRERKLIETAAETLVPVIVVSSASIASVVTTPVAVFGLSFVALAKIFQLQISREFRQTYKLKLGKETWMATIAVGLVLTLADSYFLFYAVLLVGVEGAIDFFDLTRRASTR